MTGGRLRVGLDCLGLGAAFGTKRNAGECEDIEVGVEVRLKGPGDSEQRVEGLLGHPTASGVESGKFWVESGYSDRAVRTSLPPEPDTILDDTSGRALGM